MRGKKTISKKNMSEKKSIESIRDLLYDEKQTVETIFNDIVVPEFTTEESLKKIIFSIDEFRKIERNPTVKLRFAHYQILVLFLLAQITGQNDPIDSDIYQKILIYLQTVMPIAASLSDTSAHGFLTSIEDMILENFPETVRKLENDIGYSIQDDKDDNQPLAVLAATDGGDSEGKPKRKYYGNAIHAPKEKIVAPLKIGGNYTTLRHSIGNNHIEQPKMVRLRFKKPHPHEKKRSRD